MSQPRQVGAGSPRLEEPGVPIEVDAPRNQPGSRASGSSLGLVRRPRPAPLSCLDDRRLEFVAPSSISIRCRVATAGNARRPSGDEINGDCSHSDRMTFAPDPNCAARVIEGTGRQRPDKFDGDLGYTGRRELAAVALWTAISYANVDTARTGAVHGGQKRIAAQPAPHAASLHRDTLAPKVGDD